MNNQKNNNKIFVTKTFLPPLEEYVDYLKKAWDKRWMTNNGSLALELEKKLKEYLGVKHVFFVSNGTIALQMAIKALDLKNEIITTPFSFIATTSSILWERCTPVFVDIDPKTFTIDPNKIEEAITDKTEAILAVHVYGYPSHVKEIERIAKKHNLKVIYDAAHVFGVKIDGKSIFNFGDISTLSLHATKLFHTGEGGLVITNDDKLAKKIDLLRDFGLEGEEPVDIGINAKNSELHASLGLANFKYIDEIISARKTLVEEYIKELSDTGIHNVDYSENVTYNYAYFPVVFDTEEVLFKIKDALARENIFPRRYFHPSLNTLSFVPYKECRNSESISKRVLCLPLYHDLNIEDVRKITGIIKETLSKTLPTIAIGIPAYNEERNIVQLLNAIVSQDQISYRLNEIIINSDGSNDNTIKLLKELKNENPKIKILENTKRKGKAQRLNEIYNLHNSDYLLTLDADVLPKDSMVIEKMVNVFLNDKDATVVAGNMIPSETKTFIGKIIYTNNILWNKIRVGINHGDHIANLYGEAAMLRKDFSKSFSYPTNISCDEEYLYIMAKQNNGFRFAKDAQLLFNVPQNLKDFMLQGRRALKERYLLVGYFGKDITKLHKIPLRYKITGIVKMMLAEPLYTNMALLFNVFVRFWPYNDSLNKQGMWEIASSTKGVVKN